MFAKNIRFLRRRAAMSQDKLAELLGYKSFTTVQKWESGVSEPPIGVAQKIALMFHVDLDDPLKAEGMTYGRRLAEAGVPVSHKHFDEMIHAFIQFTGVVEEASEALDFVCADLRRDFAG